MDPFRGSLDAFTVRSLLGASSELWTWGRVVAGARRVLCWEIALTEEAGLMVLSVTPEEPFSVTRARL